MIKVSVVMPCLNGMKFLDEAMESVLNQTLQEMEIIVVDAGSTDGTLEALARYAAQDSRLRIIHSEKKSMGAQYNLGMAEARGKYVGFCETDDYVDLTMYETLYGWAEEYEAEYVKSDFKMFVEASGERIFLPYNIIPLQREELEDCLIDILDHKEILLYDLNMWNGIYRRDFLDGHHIRLNETKGAAFQDMGFVLQVNMLAKRGLHKRTCFYYYRRDNENSSTYNKDICRYVLDELKYILNFVEAHGELQSTRPYLCRRFTNSFFSKYFTILRRGGTPDDVMDDLREMQSYLRREWERTSQQDKLKTMMWYDIGLRLFMASISAHSEYILRKLQMEKESYDAFMDEVGTRPEVVIVGCGERGRSLFTFMERRGVSSDIVFADNNEKLWGKTHMGHPIYSLPEVTEKHPKAAYVVSVANDIDNMALRSQLRSLGILEEKLYVGINVSPHDVTDVKGL